MGLAGVWASMHVMLARLTETPELAMTEADAKTLFVAAQNVLRHYSIASTQKTIDWITFASVAGFMYVPRFVAIGRRRQRGHRQGQRPGERQGQPDFFAGPAQVFQFHPPGQPGNGAAREPAAAVEPEIMDPIH